MKIHFDQLFKTRNGSLIPKVRLIINEQTRNPGTLMKDAAILAGINTEFCIDKYFEVDIQSGVYSIVGVYESRIAE